MRHDVVEIKPNLYVDSTLEELRQKIADFAGVTLYGNRLTVRFNNKEVHMVILEVEDGRPVCAECEMVLVEKRGDLCSECRCPK